MLRVATGIPQQTHRRVVVPCALTDSTTTTPPLAALHCGFSSLFKISSETARCRHTTRRQITRQQTSSVAKISAVRRRSGRENDNTMSADGTVRGNVVDNSVTSPNALKQRWWRRALVADVTVTVTSISGWVGSLMAIADAIKRPRRCRRGKYASMAETWPC
jgi:hypothetical protein